MTLGRQLRRPNLPTVGARWCEAALPEGGWLLFRTGWDARAHDEELFLNYGSNPGFDAGCSRWLAEESTRA